MSSRIYVTGLPTSIEESDIRAVFGPYGNIRVIYIPKEKVRGHSSCFVSFSKVEEAQAAVNELCYSDFIKNNEKTTIKITFGDEKTLELIKNGENRILIEGIGKDVTESAVYDAFRHFGEVVYCVMPVTVTNRTIGNCFVTYRTKEEADNAIEHMNNSTINGKTITVRYAPKE